MEEKERVYVNNVKSLMEHINLGTEIIYLKPGHYEFPSPLKQPENIECIKEENIKL